MKRWHEDYKITVREWKKHRRGHVEINKTFNKTRVGQDPDVIDCECNEQKGRFRKNDASDCGHVRCRICHPYKFPKRIKHGHEIRSDLSFKEQLKSDD